MTEKNNLMENENTPPGLGEALQLHQTFADPANDMHIMHAHYGIHDRVNTMDSIELRALLKFRLDFLQEELDEGNRAYAESDPEEIVDAMIDLCVVAIGTLDLFGVNFNHAWNEVYNANMNKDAGVNPSRPNPLGLPDLIKKDGWVPPDHRGNHGTLPAASALE